LAITLVYRTLIGPAKVTSFRRRQKKKKERKKKKRKKFFIQVVQRNVTLTFYRVQNQ